MLNSKFLFYTVMPFLLILPVFGEFWAQELPDDTPSYTVFDSGVNLINIGEIDETPGTYWLDFFFYLKSDNVDFIQDVPEIAIHE